MKKEMVYVMPIGAIATAELLGLLVGWLIYKITSRWFPALHAVLQYIDRMSRCRDAITASR
jgi:hypothetical protein